MSKKLSKVSEKRISVGISEETEAELISYAEQEGVAMSWVIRKALMEFLNRNLKQKELPIQLRDE